MIREVAFNALFLALKIIAPITAVMMVLIVLLFFSVIALGGLYTVTWLVEQIHAAIANSTAF